MRRVLWPWWTVLLWIAIWVAGVLAVTMAHASCARTPADAARAVENGEAVSAGLDDGFRVESIRWDPVLRRQWALIVSCVHPEWPAVELPVSGISTAANGPQPMTEVRAAALLPMTVVPMVRAGDAVELWIRQGDLRIEAAAIAEQSGGVGQSVRVRLMQRKTLGQQIEREFSGVIRGPREVEMQQ